MNEPVCLRALENDDLERTHRWHNDRKLYETLGSVFHYVSKGSEKAWLENKSRYLTNEINLAICIRESQTHIGNIYLREIDWISRHAVLEVFIGEVDAQSRGYGQSALRQMLSYAFLCLGLNRIVLHVLADNQRAVHVYEKCGFKVEGRLRMHVFKDGAWKDLVSMGILRDEWSGPDNDH